MKSDPYLTPQTKIKPQWTKDLNVTPKTAKLLGKNIREKLHDNGLGKDFMDMTPKAQAKKQKQTSETTSN